jgi:hypothetical protein
MQKASIMLTKILAPVVQLVNISHPIDIIGNKIIPQQQ